MASSVEDLIERIRVLEDDLEEVFEQRRTEFAYEMKNRRVVFEQAARKRHRELRTRLLTYLKGARLAVILTAPVIYAGIVPFVLLDLFVSLYQAVCFPVYRIARVPRGDYIAFDRHALAYLNGLEKLNCLYCSYANGLIAWTREIAARTEQYWCPIKHARKLDGVHTRYAGFVDYGDAERYREGLRELRARLEAERPAD